MTEAHLLLGSNKGNRAKYMAGALKLIEFRCGPVKHRSALYETEAWGDKQQQAFLNQAVTILTKQAPIDLLHAIKRIEKEAGRTESTRWGPREIDIDILFYGNEVVELPELKIPHPYLHQRRFTLVPLHEIAPELVHPVLQKPVRVLLQECSDESEVTKYS
jgi:2-amino-4-hydroxy-6-hydroxymethyldihydropteridine diphosphokinase